MNGKDFVLTSLEDEHMVKSSGLAVRRQGLYPSEASVECTIDGKTIVRGKCLRGAYYRATGLSQTNPGGARLMGMANLGVWDERGLIERWKEMGLWVDNNVKFFDEKLYVSGEVDAILHPPGMPEYRIGYEVKTHYGNYSNATVMGKKGRKSAKSPTGYSETQPRVNGAPKIDQFLQACFYSHFYVTVRRQLDEFRMLYLERGDGKRNEFRVGTELKDDGTHVCWYEQIQGKYWNAFDAKRVYLPFTIEGVHDRYKSLVKHLRDKTTPPMDFMKIYTEDYVEWAFKNGELGKTKYEAFMKKKENIGDWQCSYCSHKDRCDEEEAVKDAN